jgi:hypothetical protein
MKSTLLSIVAALMFVSLGLAQEKTPPQEKKAAPVEAVAPARTPAEHGTMQKGAKKAAKSKMTKKAGKKAKMTPEKKGS